MQFVDDQRHLLAGAHQQRAKPDGVSFFLDRFGDDRFSRHLLAQVDHAVTVVGKDRLDQVLADIVHITVHGRQHELALAYPFLSFQEVLQVRYRFFHHFCRLQYKRKDQLSTAESVADFFHRGQQHLVEDAYRFLTNTGAFLPLCQNEINVILDLLLETMHDLPMQTFSSGHRSQCFLLGVFAVTSRTRLLEVLDQSLQRIRFAVEDQVFSQFALQRRNIRVRSDGRRVHNGHIKSGLHRVIQHHAVDHTARPGSQAEGYITDSQRSQYTR